MDNAKTKIEPTENRIVIKQDDAIKDKKKGAIIIAGDDRKPNYGTIIAVGPGRKRDDGTRTPMTLQVGWRVVFPTYGTTPIEVGDETFLVIDEPAVLAVFVNP